MYLLTPYNRKCAIYTVPSRKSAHYGMSAHPLFWLNFLLRSKVYVLYIVHNLLHYNNDAAASYFVCNYVNMPVGCG